MIKKNQNLILLLLIGSLFISCAEKAGEPVTASEFLLGTTCVITLSDWEKDADPDSLLNEAFHKIAEMEQQLSVNIETSDIARINAGGDEGFAAGPMALDVLKQAIEIAELSEGRFDPSIGGLVALWGIGTENAGIPGEDEISTALSGINYKEITIEDSGLVILENPNAALDLGGIAKGYAADLVREFLTSRGVRRGIINLGGNVLVLGRKENREPWRIGIQDPREPRGEYLGIVEVDEKAIVTSGVYERFFMEDGVRYHHILDTRTGYPVRNGVISTTVIHDRSVIADGLSTSLFAMGIEKGMELANSLEDTNVIMIDEDNRVYITDNLTGSFQLNASSGYTLAGNQN